MYQLAGDPRCSDRTQLFVQTCTSMIPNAENMHLVRSAASLVRGILEGGDIAPLRELLQRAQEWCSDLDDVLAAAGQAALDDLNGFSRAGLHDAVRRVAEIERDVFAGICRRDLDAPLCPVLAG